MNFEFGDKDKLLYFSLNSPTVLLTIFTGLFVSSSKSKIAKRRLSHFHLVELSISSFQAVRFIFLRFQKSSMRRLIQMRKTHLGEENFKVKQNLNVCFSIWSLLEYFICLHQGSEL